MLLCHPPPCSLAICVWARCREAAGLSAVHKLSATGALGEPACFPWLPASCLLGLHCLLAQGRRLAQPQQVRSSSSSSRQQAAQHSAGSAQLLQPAAVHSAAAQRKHRQPHNWV
jgi:hypothetical protein